MGKKIELDEKLILQKYSEFDSMEKVSLHFGLMSTQPIIRILNKYGISRSTRKYQVNENYFDNIDSEEKAYWLGFLYADGYIREPKSGSSLGLKLSQLDRDHLEIFKKTINSKHRIVSGVSTTKNKKGKEYHSKTSIFTVYSNRLVESIKSQGFHSRKTFTIDSPTIKEEYYRHFIRGFFDGDGCCYIKKIGKSVFTSYSFCCASPKLRRFIINELSKYSINSQESNIIININQNISSYKLYHYLYDDATVYLKRKRDKGDIFLNYYNMKRNNGMYCFQNDYVAIDRSWSQQDIDTVKKYHNLIPLSYLSYSILSHKNCKQILRLCRKLKIKNDKKMCRKDYEDFCKKNNIIPYIDL
jgi:hypothetical protein